MIYFAVAIYRGVGMVCETKISSFKLCAEYFFTACTFAHEFHQDGMISMQNRVDLLSGSYRGFTKVYVVIIFAP